MAWRGCTVDPDGELPRIPPAVIRMVTAHTGDRAVSRPACVPEKLLTESDLFRCERVVLRYKRGLFLKPQGQHQVVLPALNSDRQHHGPQNPERRPSYGPGMPPTCGTLSHRLSFLSLLQPSLSAWQGP